MGNLRNMDRTMMIAENDWDNPEEFYAKHFGATSEILHELVGEHYPDCDVDKLAFLYENYNYLERQVIAFVENDSYMYHKSRSITHH